MFSKSKLRGEDQSEVKADARLPRRKHQRAGKLFRGEDIQKAVVPIYSGDTLTSEGHSSAFDLGGSTPKKPGRVGLIDTGITPPTKTDGSG